VKQLNLGCGVRPMPGAVNHDRVRHAGYVDVAHDLDILPWPWADEEFDRVYALDVMEHLKLDVQQWLDECWRILKPGGLLALRVAGWKSPNSWRDPTHRRVFDVQSFDYWDPTKELYHNYGHFYFAESNRWWRVEEAGEVNGGDVAVVLRKLV